jgi:hypothetical protein
LCPVPAITRAIFAVAIEVVIPEKDVEAAAFDETCGLGLVTDYRGGCQLTNTQTNRQRQEIALYTLHCFPLCFE